MDNNDGISVLTFQEGEQQAVFCVNGPRRYFCKYESCAKSFLHTSSLYRHHRIRHVGGVIVKRENLNANSSTDSSGTNLYVDKSMQEEIQELEQQMVSAGQGALFAQFHSLFEAVPHADQVTLAHLRSFHHILQKALLQAARPVYQGKRTYSAVADHQGLTATTLFIPSTGLSLHNDHIFASARVEFSDEGETSPSKRANSAADVFDMYEPSPCTNNRAARGAVHHNTVTPRESSLPQGGFTHVDPIEPSTRGSHELISLVGSAATACGATDGDAADANLHRMLPT